MTKELISWIHDDRIASEIRRALPAHVPVDWFLRCAQTALLVTPKLVTADRPSLLRELVAVAQLGLVTDPQLGEAWLIVDHKGIVQRRVGYQGLRKLALQSGDILSINAQAVYRNDECWIVLGDSPSVRHNLNLEISDRGDILGCYATAKIKGALDATVEWMSWQNILAHRDRYSDAYNASKGPWTDPLAEVEMGRKTVFRRLCKWLPKSPLLAEALAAENRAEMHDITPEKPAKKQPLEAKTFETWTDIDGRAYHLEPGKEVDGWLQRRLKILEGDGIDRLIELNPQHRTQIETAANFARVKASHAAADVRGIYAALKRTGKAEPTVGEIADAMQDLKAETEKPKSPELPRDALSDLEAIQATRGPSLFEATIAGKLYRQPRRAAAALIDLINASSLPEDTLARHDSVMLALPEIMAQRVLSAIQARKDELDPPPLAELDQYDMLPPEETSHA